METVICPCCDQATVRRLTRITDWQCEAGFRLMHARGWTRERLLAEKVDELDFIAPAFTDWLRAMPPEYP